ncbi:MAG: MoxR family ATPase [Clostridiales bacterium]|nr:MoxR family ATPase [Clostridiales bacterium]
MSDLSVCEQIIKSIESVFITEDPDVLKKILCAFLSGGHILLEDNPGLGKTSLVKAIARTLNIEWKRIQFTPDLMPSDIIGTKIWDTNTSSFKLERGPLFTNFLLADEINRAMPKTQSALLEAMEEKQITIDGITHKLQEPFIVMATQNPIEMEGTYQLPEAQLDRFAIKLSLGYLQDIESECKILKNRISKASDDVSKDITAVVSKEDIINIRQDIESIFVHDNIIKYITKIVRQTRVNNNINVGASPRGALALLKLTKALAYIEDRTFVTPDDVKMLAPDILGHRVLLNFESAMEGVKATSVILDILDAVPVPKDFV